MLTRLTTTLGARRCTWSEGGKRVGPCRLNLVVPPYEGVREDTRIYLRYRDDPWTTKSDPGFEEFYDVGADPSQVRNLAYYGEVSRRRWIACKTGCSDCVGAGPTGAGRQRTGVDERVVYARVMP